jgi:hypothetical protein
MRSAESILALFESRKTYYQPLHAGMAEIAAIYDGEASVALPDMGRDEPSSVPNLLAQGVDQMAGRISSVIPQVVFASESPGQRTADRRATTASQVVTGWWEEDRLPMKMKARARHLIAYGLAPAVVRYCPVRKKPTWDVRNPMETFPNVDRIPGTTQPVDVIFAYQRSVGWLRERGYAEAVGRVTGRWDTRPDTLLLVLEYIDSECVCLCIAGYNDPTSYLYGWSQYAGNLVTSMKAEMIESYETSGIMTASVPTRLTLNRPGGQFDSMIGMYYAQAKLMALEVLAVEKGVFPDTYLESRPGEVARFIDGPWDGRTGQVNITAGGTIREVSTQPGYMTPQTIDRLERAQRVTAGIPAEFGGESGSNIRTGRRGDAVLSAVIDFPVSEAQEVISYGLVDEDRAAISLAKQFDGGETRHIYVGVGNSRKPVTYIAEKVFTHDEHMVSYPVVGTDMNSLIIGLGQRVGLGIMSKETAAELDPFIADAEQEHDRVIAEGLEQALLSGIQQRASAPPEAGGIPPMVLAKVMTLVKNDRMELAEAMTKVTEDAMKAQQEQAAAQQAQMAGPESGPTAEQAMAAGASGLTGSPIPGANQGQQDLGTLLSTLRRPVMAVANRAGTVSSETGRAAM